MAVEIELRSEEIVIACANIRFHFCDLHMQYLEPSPLGIVHYARDGLSERNSATLTQSDATNLMPPYLS